MLKFEDFVQSESEIGKNMEDTPQTQINMIKKTDSRSQLFTEEVPEKMNLNILQNNLGNCLNIVEEEVMKGYVIKLDQLPIIKPETVIDNDLQDIHFFKISELVYQEDEFSVDNLSMVFQTLSNKPCTLAMMLRSDGEKTDFYLGARPRGNNSAGTLFQMLKQSLLGFFPGSRITEYYDEDMKRDMHSVEVGCITSVTCVADYKQSEEHLTNKDFIQGLEKFVFAMAEKSYTAIFIADNILHDELVLRKREYEQIYTQISPFVNMQMNFSVSDSGSASAGVSEGESYNTSYTLSEGTADTNTDNITHTKGTGQTAGVTETDSNTYTTSDSMTVGKTHTEGRTDGTSTTRTEGASLSGFGGVSSNKDLHLGSFVVEGVKNAGITMSKSYSTVKGMNHTESVSDSISKTLSHGISNSRGNSHSVSGTYSTNVSGSVSKSTGKTTSSSLSDTKGEALNFVNTRTLTETFGSSKGVTLNAENMTLRSILKKIQKHLERIEECESFGMWNFAAYFLGETAAETETAANTYKSVIAGNDSGIERSAINSWRDEHDVEVLFKYISAFIHPQFVYHGFSYDESRYVAVAPSALVSTKELALHMGLPRHSVRGLPVVEHAQFAQEVVKAKKQENESIHLGKVYNLGKITQTNVSLDLNSLSMHTFITGSTGAGKSNAVYHLLSQVRKKEIPFLIIEPAKGEYKTVFPDIECYGTNPRLGKILKINPFSFSKEIHVLEHIDRIVEIFNVCWPMYAAMPVILKESIEQAYVSAGWNLELSENTQIDGLFPTFDDVLRELNQIISQSEYSSDTKGDYIGSLSVRIKSLTNGINGRIFVSDEMSLEELFDKNAIIDISHVGAIETKSLIMGIIVLKLQEYRMAKARGMNMPLKHITVLEEAHNLLKKTTTEQSTDSSNVTGKSVEMLTNAIAEIRTYGEGFVIVDQAPALLDTAAIRNTNTKIVMRLPESTDRKITGSAIALKDWQYTELSKLPTGVAAVYQNDWQEAVLCSLPKYESFGCELRKKTYHPIQTQKAVNKKLLKYLLKKELTASEKDISKKMIIHSNVSAKIRKDLIMNFVTRNLLYEWAVADFISKNFDFSNVFRGTSNCESLEQFSQIAIQNIRDEFDEFEENELLKIMYYICRIEHEKHPENIAIEQLRTEYLREKLIK